MSYFILISNGYVSSQTTLQRITNLESDISENQLMFSEFDKEIKSHIKGDGFQVERDLPDPVK